jgi:serine/threonine-protein kinase RsbW
LKKTKIFNCKIPGNINNVRNVVKNVINYLQDFYGPIDDCTQFEIKVILNELVLNAVKHGVKEDDNKHVEVTASITRDNCALLVIEDEGDGYDYRCLLNCICPQHETGNIFDAKETGRGILIVKNLCDNMTFNKKGNKITVLKKLCKETE